MAEYQDKTSFSKGNKRRENCPAPVKPKPQYPDNCPPKPSLQVLQAYSLSEFAALTGKSCNLIYRRLTEKPQRYAVRFARREGERWVFDRRSVDAAITAGESLIIRKNSLGAIDRETALKYITGGFRSCGKESL